MHASTRKHAHTDQYVIFIAFPQQQWFREHASMLRYTYVGCLVCLRINFHVFMLFLLLVLLPLTLQQFLDFGFLNPIIPSFLDKRHFFQIFKRDSKIAKSDY
jgi:hypothetical protein